MGEQQWDQLCRARDAAWDEAEEVSHKAGFPFKNRNGEMVNNARTDLVFLSLVQWCKKHDVTYITPSRSS